MKRTITLLTALLLALLAASHAATNAPAPAKASVAEGNADPGLGTRDKKKSAAITDPAILDLSLEPPVVKAGPDRTRHESVDAYAVLHTFDRGGLGQ